MKKYIIIPKDIEIEKIEAESKEEAMNEFALNLDLDMNTYFIAKEENKLSTGEYTEQYQAFAFNKKTDQYETVWHPTEFSPVLCKNRALEDYNTHSAKYADIDILTLKVMRREVTIKYGEFTEAILER